MASVPQRSPLRYPDGKMWLIPHVRYWLEQIDATPKLLIEPFAGGGIVSLTAIMERLVGHCLMMELDRDVAAFWHTALRHGPQLCEMVKGFEPTRDSVDMLSRQIPSGVLEHGFRTLVLNRTQRAAFSLRVRLPLRPSPTGGLRRTLTTPIRPRGRSRREAVARHGA
ncbi:MAG: hypothetical protein OXE76_08710 [Alphaproteobacteria bacterium]|nr:hypothetical protein [Alphaproteobacteria bacterium]